MRQDELLSQAVRLWKLSIEFRCIDECVIGSKGDVGVKAPNRRISASSRAPGCLARVVAPADVETNALPMGAVEDGDHVN